MTAAQSTERPAKPAGSPLYPHPGGQWVKKVTCPKSGKRKTIYCGPWNDHAAALRHWLDVKDGIMAGVDPVDRDGLTIADLCGLFLDSKEAKVELGKMTKRSFTNYHQACQILVDHFGKGRKVSTLRPADFTQLRQAFPATWKARSCKNRVTDIRCVFSWGYKEDHLEASIKFGENFAVSKKELKADQRGKPKKLFTAAEIHRLIAAADNPQLKAMILLGINAGFGNKECSALRLDDIGGAWLETHREKTGEDRRVWLWPETREAIKAAIRYRPSPKPGLEDRVFLTYCGDSWVSDIDNRDAVGEVFLDVKKAAKCHRAGVGFYALRHTFQTEAEELVGDMTAIRRVMGHTDPTISAEYRERISDHRIRKVCEAVRQWFLAGTPKARVAR